MLNGLFAFSTIKFLHFSFAAVVWKSVIIAKYKNRKINYEKEKKKLRQYCGKKKSMLVNLNNFLYLYL